MPHAQPSAKRSIPPCVCDTALVRPKRGVVIAVLAGAGIAVAVAGSVLWERRHAVSPAALLRRLPIDNSLLLYSDFNAWRQAGSLQLLDGSKAGQDPGYLGFVPQTRVNYKR